MRRGMRRYVIAYACRTRSSVDSGKRLTRLGEELLRVELGDPDRTVPWQHDDEGELAGKRSRGMRVADA